MAWITAITIISVIAHLAMAGGWLVIYLSRRQSRDAVMAVAMTVTAGAWAIGWLTANA